MLVVEFRPIPKESVGHEYRNIICPAVAGGGTKQDPFVFLCDLQKRFDPASTSNNTLFIKYEECVLHANVLPNIVPRVYDDRMLVNIKFRVRPHVEMSQLFVPLTCIPFPGSRYDIKIRGLRHSCIFFCVYLSTIESVVKRQTRSRFSASYASA